MNIKNLFIMPIFLILVFGCSHQNLENETREIASIPEHQDKECLELLDKFLPKNTRFQVKIESLVPMNPKNSILNPKFLPPKIAKEVEKDVQVETADLFNTFQKEVKDLAHEAQFKMLVDPHEALMARIMLIRKAKTSIDLTYYIFQDSETSKILIDEIRQALRRGVNVRMMVDGSGSIAATSNFFKEIQVLSHTLGGKIYDKSGNVIGNAKFEAVEINPTFNVRAQIKEWYSKMLKFITGKDVPVDDYSIFHRSHDKILLIDAHSPDDSMAIIGGRNISNHYYKVGTEEERDSTFNDLDILVKNVAYQDSNDDKIVVKNALLDHFNRLYFYSANKKFEEFIFKITRNKASTVLREIRNTRNEVVRSDKAELNEVLKKMGQADFLNSDFDRGYVSFLDEIENLTRKNILTNMEYKNANSIMKNLWEQVQKAENDILICSPYIYLTDKEIDFLVNWLHQNPNRTLRIITNSSATSDNLFAQAMVEHFVMPKLIEKLKQTGVSEKQFEILAYGNLDNKEFGGKIPQGKLHAKFWLIDNFAIGVGTSNFDPVSRLTNSEVMTNAFPTEGQNSLNAINKYYASLKENSTRWNSEDFYKSKFRKELKKKLIIQDFIAKIIGKFKLLPQN